MGDYFFRFPHTPHLAWLGKMAPRNDKVMAPIEAQHFLAAEVVVEEKLDGANLGLSLETDGVLRVQNRGQYLVKPYLGQFARLPGWLAQHDDALRFTLTPDLILFGEWCAARHSLDYTILPDWFLLFDVYDRATRRFWSTARRNALASEVGLTAVPELLRGKTNLTALKQIVDTTQSSYRQGSLEGIVIRRETTQWLEARAKLVRPDFSQAIDTHWRRRAIQWNRIETSGN